ncbi:unnamed protein product (macronuclear) [Paramecium tetraurelia]|uniref:Peptidase A1 domain-containing protein n=1 Tax=Paramecium tetraurelia TaxID=5888 RepID=A0C8M6_PARTE|nr:uncharacterized protein GSPATT00036277001 [Paramecium tetraurelia]CAK67143.1 unnamed protein product [Paramecium tetraurelia]|eukprot:XP_001434540.1 hypothetical protein (macronuclear) [Paramecium tetraurelia strain d4-2]
MIIFLITSVFASHIYPIAQNPKTFAFQLTYQQGSLTLDLNSQLTFMKLKGEEVKCNSSPFGDQIECSSCTPNCVIGDGNLMQSDAILINVLQEEQTEKMLYVSTDQEEILGLGQQRGSSKTPQNPFLSNIFHICLGYDKGFISKEFKNPYKKQINYKSNSSSKYQVDLKQIKIQNQTIVNLTGKVTYVDSRDPYILLPEENYQKIITYFSKFQVVEESHTLIVKNQSLKLPDIEFIFDDDDEKIIMEPEAYILKLSNDTHILRFNRSKLNRIELGLPFLAQKLITIDQNTEKFYFSDFNCQDQFQQIQLEIDYFKQILLPTLLICLVFYCILTQKAKTYKQSKANESYELTKLKQEIEEEEEI